MTHRMPRVPRPVLSFLITSLFSFSSGCLSTDRRSQPKAFDWNTDLPALETTPNDQARTWNDGSRFDQNFCKNQKPGTCFTLVLRVPTSELVQDLGLSVLALGNSSKAMRVRMDEACRTAWSEYRQKYLFDNFHPLRRDFVKGIEKMRCIFLFMGEEVATENLKLAKNEVALSARLTKFELLTSEISANARSLGGTLLSKAVQTQFRSVSLYSGSELGSSSSGWQIGEGLGVAPLRAEGTMERKIQWNIDTSALQESLLGLAANTEASKTAVSSFLKQAKDQIEIIASSSQNPLSGSFLLVGMGYNAFRSLCGEDRQYCKLSSSQSSSTEVVQTDLADLVPSSDTNELLRLALIRSIQGVLDESLSQLNPEQVKANFGIP